jgi:DNA-binding Lrp family transcriptional regulator
MFLSSKAVIARVSPNTSPVPHPYPKGDAPSDEFNLHAASGKNLYWSADDVPIRSARTQAKGADDGTRQIPKGTPMVDAIVMVNAESNKINDAAQAIVEIDGVKDVYSVAGDIDLVAVVSTPAFEDLTTIIPGGIAKVDGVLNTQTLMAFKTYSDKELSAAFDLGLD